LHEITDLIVGWAARPVARPEETAMTEALIAELEREAATTRKVLERVPEDRFSWKPHERSMSLGQLAFHIAALPGGIAQWLDQPAAEPPNVPLPEPSSRQELLDAFDAGVRLAVERIKAWGPEGLQAEWRLLKNGETVLAAPRGAMVRTLMLNHAYHHRGQLTVYLRLLNVPVPAVYGPSADEAFGA